MRAKRNAHAGRAWTFLRRPQLRPVTSYHDFRIFNLRILFEYGLGGPLP